MRVEDSLGDRSVAATLLETADEIGAEAVVVGHHMVARPQLVGHVTGSLLHDSAIPVVIVPSDWSSDRTDGRPVAIGVGVSRGTRAALEWVLGHVGLCADGLLLVHAHGLRSVFRPEGWLDAVAYHLDPTVLSEWIEDDLADLAQQMRREAGIEVDIAVSVRPGRTGARLVDAGAGASMLVIGRGEPPFIRSHTIAPYLRHAIVHAPCPVVVAPAAQER